MVENSMPLTSCEASNCINNIVSTWPYDATRALISDDGILQNPPNLVLSHFVTPIPFIKNQEQVSKVLKQHAKEKWEESELFHACFYYGHGFRICPEYKKGVLKKIFIKR
ncbi:16072_t:CDS:2 [Rhizophagus irregularis]|nr:16072_t:CDS:2 [Rhizophagus irregularis]